MTLVYKRWCNYKEKVESFSLEYCTQLTNNTRDESGECSAAAYILTLNNKKARHRLFQNIRHMEGLEGAGASPQVRISNSDGISTDIIDPTEMNITLLNNHETLYY